MISLAWAQDAAGAAAPANDMGALLMSALPFILVFAVFYFVLLRPQMQQGKAHAALLKDLKKGDVVVTDGGMTGEVSAIKDAFVQVKVGPGTVVTLAKEAVKSVLSGEVAKDVAKMVTESKK
jgi:preprotein translocase subunit YajC